MNPASNSLWCVIQRITLDVTAAALETEIIGDHRMKSVNRNTSLLAVFSGLFFAGCSTMYRTEQPITVGSLLDEMVSMESSPCFPEPRYTSKQLTSYDRRSVIPHTPNWHANDDWSGFIRYETNNGRVEKVLFDENGPGVLTRIITTGGAEGVNLRFYLDDDKEATLLIPGYDISKFPATVPSGMMYLHETYPRHQGCSFYLPIPYQKRCRITVDNLDRGYVYHVNYRTYEPGVKVKTFTLKEAVRLKSKMAAVSEKLYNPETYLRGEVSKRKKMSLNSVLHLELPPGSQAVRTLNFNISGYNKADYEQLMRGLIVKIVFDGTQTVWVPLSDFSGAGLGSPKVDSWYLAADGAGTIIVRFVMPYKRSASVELVNITNVQADAVIKAYISDWKWHGNTLYFHASWRQERGLLTNNGNEYSMAALKGRGVYKGDVLSLVNHTPRWYGEGDEHIWVDDDAFPSHFGCGTEDYYNTTYAPIHVFHTPFGGAPRADDEAAKGCNTFFRTRNLDVIPFDHKLRFDFELLSWDTGTVDYASTVYWYGDLVSKALTPSFENEALQPLEVLKSFKPGRL